MAKRKVEPTAQRTSFLHGAVAPLAEGSAGSTQQTGTSKKARAITQTKSSDTPHTAAASSSAEKTSTLRSDVQPVAEYSRGSKSQALAIAGNPVLREKALLQNQSESYALSSRNSREDKLRTWEQVSTEAGISEPFRLTPEKVHTVMGIFKAAGYRSSVGYASLARQQHVDRYGDVPAAVTQAIKRASRAGTRGLGPAKHTNAIPFELLAAIPDTLVPKHPDGPERIGRALILGSWFLMREIEIAALTIGDITFTNRDTDTPILEVYLPRQKNDAQGSGCTRRLACICKLVEGGRFGHTLPLGFDFEELNTLCPYHSAFEQYAGNVGRFGGDPSFPLFPTARGLVQTKAGFVAATLEACAFIGVATHHPTGAPCITGHVCRATGAMHLAASGIELWRLQIHARWGSQAILLYIKDAPMRTMASLSLETMSSKDLRSIVADLSCPQPVAQKTLLPRLSPVELKVTEAAQINGPRLPREGENLILNLRSSGGPKLHSADGLTKATTRCGWRYSNAPHGAVQLTSSVETGTLCRDCFSLRLKTAPVSRMSSTSSDSESN
jgi:hypothetical protein